MTGVGPRSDQNGKLRAPETKIVRQDMRRFSPIRCVENTSQTKVNLIAHLHGTALESSTHKRNNAGRVPCTRIHATRFPSTRIHMDRMNKRFCNHDSWGIHPNTMSISTKTKIESRARYDKKSRWIRFDLIITFRFYFIL